MAEKFARRLKLAIHKDAFLKKYKLNVSGGISQFAGKKDTRSKFMTRADKALYKAKESGRDKFVVG